jgi:hypothetical protein
MDVFKINETVPNDDRVVVLQDYQRQQPLAMACRFVDERWIGVSGNTDVTDFLTPDAVWFESALQAKAVQPERLAS